MNPHRMAEELEVALKKARAIERRNGGRTRKRKKGPNAGFKRRQFMPPKRVGPPTPKEVMRQMISEQIDPAKIKRYPPGDER